MLVLYIIILMFTNSINHLQKHIHSIFINRITIITLLISILFTFNTLYFQSIGKGISIYSGLYQTTAQSQIVEIFLLIVGISILLSWPIMRDSRFMSSKSDQYSLIAIFSILGGSLLMSSLDLLSMYLSIELQSFALYILATLNKERLSSTSAGLKYFLLGSLSSCFILLGSAIIYSYTGLTQFEALNSIISVPTQTSYETMFASSTSRFALDGVAGTLSEGNGSLGQLVQLASSASEMGDTSVYSGLCDQINKAFTIGLIIIIIGFLFKISAAPFYQWAPDVYDGTPTIVTVWLTIVVKITILIFLQSLIEFTLPQVSGLTVSFAQAHNNLIAYISSSVEQVYPAIIEAIASPASLQGAISVAEVEGGVQIKNLLLISSLLSLLVGTIAGLSQIKIKRLLAFSSISHVGFLLLALGIYTQKSVDSLFFYLVQYSITSLNIFLILLAFGYVAAAAHFTNGGSRNKAYFAKRKEVLAPSRFAPDATLATRDEDNSDVNYIIELKGQLYKNPILSISLAICLFSMAGIPPLIGFFSKQFVLFSSIENGNNFLSIVAILVSVISASYYLRLIKITFFDSPSVSKVEEEEITSLSINPQTSLSLAPRQQNSVKVMQTEGSYEKVVNTSSKEASEESILSWSPALERIGLSNFHSYCIAILTFLILFFFLDPSILLNGTQLISLTIFNI